MTVSSKRIVMSARLVQMGFGNAGQGFVGIAFFIQGFLKQVCHLVESQSTCECSGTSITRHLVVFDSLCGPDQRQIFQFRIALQAHDLGTLGNQSLHGFTGFGLRIGTQELECLIQSCALSFGFTKVILKRSFQFFAGRRVSHLGESLDELVFGAGEIAKLHQQHGFEILEVHRVAKHFREPR